MLNIYQNGYVLKSINTYWYQTIFLQIVLAKQTDHYVEKLEGYDYSNFKPRKILK